MSVGKMLKKRRRGPEAGGQYPFFLTWFVRLEKLEFFFEEHNGLSCSEIPFGQILVATLVQMFESFTQQFFTQNRKFTTNYDILL